MADAEVQFNAPLLRTTLARIVERVNDAVGAELEDEAETLRSLADSGVPVESGELAASSFVDSGKTRRGSPAASVGYEAPYAGAVHEGFHHGRKSKTPHQFWLQTEANRYAPGFSRRIAEVIRGEVEG